MLPIEILSIISSDSAWDNAQAYENVVLFEKRAWVSLAALAMSDSTTVEACLFPECEIR